MYDLSIAFGKYSIIKTQNDPDMLTAYRVCVVLTAWRSIPVIFLLIFVFYTIPLLVILPIQFLLASSQMIFATIFMSHLHVRDE